MQIAMEDLRPNEIEAVFGGAAGDVTVIEGPGGTITQIDLGDGRLVQRVVLNDGTTSYSIVRVNYA